jgi:N-acetylglucosamine-6-phosphate deacetylase
LQRATRLASLNPSRVVGLKNRGEIRAGSIADLIVMSPAGEVRAAIVAGSGV